MRSQKQNHSSGSGAAVVAVLPPGGGGRAYDHVYGASKDIIYYATLVPYN